MSIKEIQERHKETNKITQWSSASDDWRKAHKDRGELLDALKEAKAGMKMHEESRDKVIYKLESVATREKKLKAALKRANDMINDSYQCGWSDCADAIIRRFTAHRDRFLMPKNKHEQERLHSLNNLLDAIDRFRDTQTAIPEYQEDKDAGFPHHTIIGSKP